MAIVSSSFRRTGSRLVVEVCTDAEHWFSIASLIVGTVETASVDLVFNAGQQVKFRVHGELAVDLTGYHVEEENDYGADDYDDMTSEERAAYGDSDSDSDGDDGDDDGDDGDDDAPDDEWTDEDARRRGGDVLALTEVYNELRSDRNRGHFKLISMARIPIIQRQVRGPSNLGAWPFDLTINRLLGVFNSALIRHFVLADARFAPLALLVKAWAGRLGVNSSQHGYLSSYALYLMLIFYLQTRSPPVLPNLCAGRAQGSTLVDGYNCYFDREPQRPSLNTATHGELLIGFFRFYATEFDFENEVVSVRRAARTSKTDLQTELTALIEDTRYPSMQLKRHSLVSNWKKEVLAVEDPFENNFNPARHLQDHRFAYVMRCFKTTFVALVAQPSLATLNVH